VVSRAAHALARSPATYRLTTLVLFALAWQILASGTKALLVPTFTETVVATVEMIADPEVWAAFLTSNQAMVLGFVISVVIGIPLGFVTGRFRLMSKALDPYIDLAVAVPIAGLIPLVVMSTGIGLTSRVILVVLFTMPMVAVNAKAGVRGVDVSLIEMAHSFMASERQVWRRVLLPAALPAVMAGVRIGLGRAVTGMVLVELLMVSVGIGRLILQAEGFFQGDRLYATTLLVVFESLLLISGARLVERRITPWKESRG
jgi:ABC-type nitrate/sulfonate/bicarbonate transport system permease component